MKGIRGSDLARPSFKANPYPFYARLRAEEPVRRINALWAHAWLLTRYDDVVDFLKDERFAKDITAKMPWLPGFPQPALHHMLNRDPPDHTRLRALVSKVFTPRRIEKLRGRIEGLCEELLAGPRRDRPFDLVGGYALLIPLTMSPAPGSCSATSDGSSATDAPTRRTTSSPPSSRPKRAATG